MPGPSQVITEKRYEQKTADRLFKICYTKKERFKKYYNLDCEVFADECMIPF